MNQSLGTSSQLLNDHMILSDCLKGSNIFNSIMLLLFLNRRFQNVTQFTHSNGFRRNLMKEVVVGQVCTIAEQTQATHLAMSLKYGSNKSQDFSSFH